MFQRLFHNLSSKLRFKLTVNSLVFVGILLAFIFLRFYQLEERMPFGWDQIQNSWVMKNMIIDHHLPLEGQVAKGNSGFYLGAAYYYLLAPFYYIFKLDPLAAGVFAGIIAIINYFALYLVAKKIFSAKTALVASTIYTFSAASMSSDRIPWSVIFIPLVSVLIFYFLYEAIIGKSKNIFWLALVTGFAFHIHFTAIFFPIIIFLTSPLILMNKKSWIYALISLPFFVVWFLPSFAAGTLNGFSSAGNLSNYIKAYYIGFHLIRFIQIINDAFIQFTAILYIGILKPMSLALLPIFVIVFYRNKPRREEKILIILFALWFLVPWIVFSVYGGEISDYYFMMTRPLVYMIISYLLVRLIQKRSVILNLFVSVFGIYWVFVNFSSFNTNKYPVLPKARITVEKAIRESRKIGFADGNPEAYIYYIERLKKSKN